ncbi:MAG: LLM class flavin-dependent oxidoreductase [Nitrospinota bacterium]|jgi:5,10-methylenetetrahydromethanopterin reductase|nr:LLM class flavin-dependent oxidoreductase [Nitrospinota bacterium]
MKKFSDVHIGLSSVLSVDETVNLAMRAESLGFSRLWIAEDYHWRSATTTAAAVAHHTHTIGIGLGIVSPFTRHPGVLAMEAATLGEISGGRFVLGLGVSVIGLLRHGQWGRVRIAAGMRDGIGLVKRLLAGETVTSEGEVYHLDRAGLGFLPPGETGVPVYAGVVSPRNLETAGELADGLLLGIFCTPEFAKTCIDHFRKGAERAGRDVSNLEVGMYALMAADRDVESARAAVRDTMADYIAWGEIPEDRAEAIGMSREEFRRLTAEMADAYSRGDRGSMRKAVPEGLVDTLSITGTPEACVEALLPFAEAGATTLIPYHVLGASRVGGLETIARDIIPKLM